MKYLLHLLIKVISPAWNVVALLGILSFPNVAGATDIQVLNSLSKSINAHLQLFEGGPGKVFYGSVYEFYQDQAGMMRLALLREAALRGNTVNLTVDGHGSELSPAMIQYMESVGVHIRLFSPISILRPIENFYRNHEKVWTDGETLVVADSNEGNGFWGLPSKDRFKGFGIAIKGPAAQKAFEHEKELFSSRYAFPQTNINATPKQLSEAEAQIDKAADYLKRLKIISESEWNAGFHNVADEDIEFIHDPIHTKGNAIGVDSAVVAMIERAQPGETVFISAPYLVLPKNFMNIIKSQIGRNVRFEILTNSWKSNDKQWAQARYLAERPALLKMGVKLFEYKGPETLHIKGGAVYKNDGNETSLPEGTPIREVFTGSFQPHMRGAEYDLEDIALIKGSNQTLNHEITEGLREGLNNSNPIEFDLPEHVNQMIRCWIGALRVLSRPIRPHL